MDPHNDQLPFWLIAQGTGIPEVRVQVPVQAFLATNLVVLKNARIIHMQS